MASINLLEDSRNVKESKIPFAVAEADAKSTPSDSSDLHFLGIIM